MSLLDTILTAGGGNALQQLALRGQVTEAESTDAVSRMLPALTNSLHANAAREGGLETLMWALTRGHHQRYLEEPASLAQGATIEDGNKILGHLLGSPDASRQVAAQVASDSGIDVGAVKRMLPLMATLTMGALSKQSQSSGLMEMFTGETLSGSGIQSGKKLLEGLLGNASGASGSDVVANLARRFLG